MKLLYVGHHEVQILGDLEPIKSRTGEVLVLRVNRSADGSLAALKLDRGAAIWRLNDGALQHYAEESSDLTWASDGRVLSLENRFGRRDGQVLHSVSFLDPVSYQKTADMDVCVPSGGVEFVVASPVDKQAVVAWRDQSEWGYVGIETGAKVPSSFRLQSTKPGRTGVPHYSPDGLFVVSCQSVGPGWWNAAVHADERVLIPSEGGVFLVANLKIQEVLTGMIREVPILAELAPGWLPDDPWDPLWYQVWGPEFTSPNRCKLWMPDGRCVSLDWPLEDVVFANKTAGCK